MNEWIRTKQLHKWCSITDEEGKPVSADGMEFILLLPLHFCRQKMWLISRKGINPNQDIKAETRDPDGIPRHVTTWPDVTWISRGQVGRLTS